MSAYHIAFATDDNYAPYLSVAIASFLESRKKEWVIHILTDGLLPENQGKLLGMACDGVGIVIEDLSSEKNVASAMPLHRETISTSAYYRLYLPEILPTLDRVLYLDCDTLILQDLSPLFELDLEGWYGAAVQDLGYRLPDWPGKQVEIAALAKEGIDYAHYFNSGIIMMNLELMRADHLTEKMVEIAMNPDLMEHDQDVLNIAYNNKWIELPRKWNYNYHVLRIPKLPEETDEVAIAHFTTYKPWNKCYCPYTREWWEYALVSPFRSALCKRFMGWYEPIGCGWLFMRPVLWVMEKCPLLPAWLRAKAKGKLEKIAGEVLQTRIFRLIKAKG